MATGALIALAVAEANARPELQGAPNASYFAFLGYWSMQTRIYDYEELGAALVKAGAHIRVYRKRV